MFRLGFSLVWLCFIWFSWFPCLKKWRGITGGEKNSRGKELAGKWPSGEKTYREKDMRGKDLTGKIWRGKDRRGKDLAPKFSYHNQKKKLFAWLSLPCPSLLACQHFYIKVILFIILFAETLYYLNLPENNNVMGTFKWFALILHIHLPSFMWYLDFLVTAWNSPR